MAGSNEIKYRVDVDASRANRGLSQFGKAATRAGKDVADAMDDTASAGDKARAAIEQMAQAMDSELRDAAAAADALATALGPELTGRMNVSEVVADLNRMGVGFDEVRADADKFADTLRQVDKINMGHVNDGLGKTKTALQGVRDSSDQSRSVMANLSGNAAQSAFQNLGGNIGDVGVAIGQLAEYAVDGNVKVGNLVKLAGPMLGLAAATTVLTQAIGAIKTEDAFNAQLVDDFSQALRDGNTIAETLRQTIQGTGDLNFETGLFGGGGILGISSKTQDLIPLFNTLGLNYQDFTRLLADPSGVDQLKAMKERFLELAIAADDDATGDRFQEQAEAARDAAAGLEDYKDSSDAAVVSQEELEQFLQGSAASFGQVTTAMGRQETAMLLTATHWRRLLNDLSDGNLETERGRESWNALRDELGKTNDEMAELVQQKLAEKLEEDTAAAQELADAIAATRDSFADYNRTVRSAEFGATTFEATETAMGTFFDLVQSGAENVVNLEEAYDNLGEAAETSNGKINFDTPEGRATYKALQDLGTQLIPDITDAFHDSGGDIGRFTGSMNDLSARVLRRLQNELGLSQEDAEAMIRELGLVPENVETMYKLIGDEEAKAKLALLQGSIDALPDDVQTTVTQQIILGDYQGALRTVQNYYNRVGATIPVDADISRALEALRRLQAIARFSQVVVSVGAQSTGYSSAPAATSTRTGVAATATVAAPVSVNINTSVVGNRYDLERVVSGAVRQGVRLAGRRHLGGP